MASSGRSNCFVAEPARSSFTELRAHAEWNIRAVAPYILGTWLSAGATAGAVIADLERLRAGLRMLDRVAGSRHNLPWSSSERQRSKPKLRADEHAVVPRSRAGWVKICIINAPEEWLLSFPAVVESTNPYKRNGVDSALPPGEQRSGKQKDRPKAASVFSI